MSAELHPLCCDCDSCLNGVGGYTLPGAGRLASPQVTLAAPAPSIAGVSRFELRRFYLGALLARFERNQGVTRG